MNTAGVNLKSVAGTRKDKVLVIDDSQTNKAILEDVLRSNGYDARGASDGAEGLEVIKEWGPSVILLDIVMPGISGIELCRKVRALTLEKRPSIIIVSVKDDKDTIVEALSNGADDFISRPIDEAELVARVRAQLRISEFYGEIEEDKKNLESILAITNAITATLDPAEVLDTIVGRVVDATKALRCSIVLVADDDNGYVLASSDNPSISELKIDLAKYPEIKEAVNTRSPLVVEDIQTEPLMAGVRDLVKDLKDMSILILPIVVKDEVLGTLFLRTRKKDGGVSKKEVDFCRVVANSSFHAIKNARLFEELKSEKERLSELAIRDHLTGLYNHNFFYSRLEEEFNRAVRYETPLSIIMMDIDDFKQINDTHGHRTGDEVLKEVSAMIKRGVRRTDVVARYGGEEFAIILPHSSLDGAIDEAGRLKELISSHAYAGLINSQVTMSFGVASYPHSGVMNSGDLVGLADDALYNAKRSGKNCIKVGDGKDRS